MRERDFNVAEYIHVAKVSSGLESATRATRASFLDLSVLLSRIFTSIERTDGKKKNGETSNSPT